jgi:hypothetical protein
MLREKISHEATEPIHYIIVKVAEAEEAVKERTYPNWQRACWAQGSLRCSSPPILGRR